MEDGIKAASDEFAARDKEVASLRAAIADAKKILEDKEDCDIGLEQERLDALTHQKAVLSRRMQALSTRLSTTKSV